MKTIQVTTTKGDAIFLLKELYQHDEANLIMEDKEFNAATITISLQYNDIDLPVMGSHSSLTFIRKCCCNATGVSETEFASKIQKRYIVDAKKIFCYLAWLYTASGTVRIGTFAGYTDHTMVLHHRDDAKDLVDRIFIKQLKTAESFVKTKLKIVRTIN